MLFAAMIIIDGNNLTLKQVIDVSRRNSNVSLSRGSIERMKSSREKVEKILAGGMPMYGVNTGFGDLQSVKIDGTQIIELQKNLIRSHSSGYGKSTDEESVRAMMLIRANALAKGYSGVRHEVVESLLQLLNLHIYPHIPEKGSVGSSGDLAPLAHLALVLMGEGKVIDNGKIVDAGEILFKKGYMPITLDSKEGISLINGTSFMLANLALAFDEAKNILEHAVVSSALSMHVLSATSAPLDQNLFIARPYKEHSIVAKNIAKLLENSENIETGTKSKVQDAYSLRCTPTVLGSVLQTLKFVKGILEIELNSATDNPLVFDNVISGCNFHGEPLALSADYLSIAFVEAGNLMERRIFRMLDASLSGLKPFLADNPGVESGLMIPQYVAAALCNENKVLAYPSSADTIPTSANQEDHNSMGATSARKLREILNNVKGIVAIELLTSYRAMEMYGASGDHIEKVYSLLKERIGEMRGDIETTYLINSITKLIDERTLIENLPLRLM
jgi:histidine ammonia-lyase